MIELFKHLTKRRPKPTAPGAAERVDATSHTDGRTTPTEPKRLDDLPPEPEWLVLSRSLWP